MPTNPSQRSTTPNPPLKMPNPLEKKKRRRRYRLSETGRAALQASAQKNRPWQHSTGPRTLLGKAMTSQNTLKHGYYCRQTEFPETAAYRAFVKSMRRQANNPAAPPIGPPVVEE